MIPPNRLDRKPPRNAFAGLGANVHTGNPMVNPTRRNFAGYGPGTAARAKNKLSTPTNRLGLPFRSVADGVNLIEAIGKELAHGAAPMGPLELETFLMTDQPPTCPQCGTRSSTIDGAESSLQTAECPSCHYTYQLEADDEETFPDA